MKKIAFIFPGQGAQYSGMGKELACLYPEAMEVFDQANEVLNIDIKKLCFDGPEEQLNITENTQPAILTTSLAIAAILKNQGIIPHMVAGLSLGEYAAFSTADSIAIEEVIPLVQKRGKFMQEAVPIGVGAMAAVMGLSKSQMIEVCDLAADYGIVEVANFNCPGQIVIAGEIKAINKACEIAKDMGSKRTKILPVSAPFHSSLLSSAGTKLKNELDKIKFKETKMPVISNVDASIIGDVSTIKNNLIKQVSSSVLWEESMNKMIAEGMNTFIEVGPGKTLTSFAKKISKEITCLRVEDVKTLKETLKALEGWEVETGK
ncbi:ACP S-malonyltransferase [Irregularibacter muris]|uniref:Malonyl CoA-acyl carrier protein transacylase n=1 Tax=Irregularibacter muris TaxID=1796619 RepID=A0AAE3L3E9_9FIRM|nr:ACP S-malonyltransferase [Irregularibacter muris]MCR1898143.1 ACP S-malonyltransferase [Irregularibacter muris]